MINNRRLKNKFDKTQRKLLIYVSRAYRTASLKALQVITANVPVDLLAQERARRYQEPKIGKNALRNTTIAGRVGNRWSNLQTKAQWTKKLI